MRLNTLILLSLTVTISAADFNPMMAPSSDADRFVRRIRARYGVMPDGFYRQPVGSDVFLTYLDSLDGLPLSARERYTLDGLRGRHSIDNGLYGFRGDDDKYGLVVNLGLTGEMWSRVGGEADLRAGGRGIIGPSVRGHIGKLSFYSSVDVWTEYVYDSLFYGNDFQPYNGIPYSVYGKRDERDKGGNMRASDLPRCGVGYDAYRISLQGGIDYLRLGPAVHYPVTLSGTAPPITYARAILDFTHIEYYHVVGLLRSQKDKPKYIYANGLRGTLLDGRVEWGINEVLIGGSTTNQQDDDPENPTRPQHIGEEQSWEPAYFIPFVPMVFVEHYAGDRGNAALSFDIAVNWPKDFRFYGEFFMDDIFTPWQIFSNDWGNKWAMTLGMQYFTSLYGRDVSAGIEWSRVEPWVYTHAHGGSHRYDHFDKCLGSPMGPNSMAIVANGDIGITPKITAGVKLTSLSNNPTARGGKITDIFQDGDPDLGIVPDSPTKKFLGPGTVHYLRPGIYGMYDPFGLFRVNALLEVDVARDKGRVHIGVDGGFWF